MMRSPTDSQGVSQRVMGVMIFINSRVVWPSGTKDIRDLGTHDFTGEVLGWLDGENAPEAAGCGSAECLADHGVGQAHQLLW